jgi:hypothetical protein
MKTKKRKNNASRLTLYSLAYKLKCDGEGNIIDMYMSNAKPCRECASTITDCDIHFKSLVYSNDENTPEIQNQFTKLRIKKTCRDYTNIMVDAVPLKGTYRNYNFKQYITECINDSVFKNEINDNQYIILPYNVYYRAISNHNIINIECSNKVKMRITIEDTVIISNSIKKISESIDTDNCALMFGDSEMKRVRNYRKLVKRSNENKYVCIRYSKG